ncbi:hypothetical protein GCM10009122_02480 [Fulvivirga kasyanovii]
MKGNITFKSLVPLIRNGEYAHTDFCYRSGKRKWQEGLSDEKIIKKNNIHVFQFTFNGLIEQPNLAKKLYISPLDLAGSIPIDMDLRIG